MSILNLDEFVVADTDIDKEKLEIAYSGIKSILAKAQMKALEEAGVPTGDIFVLLVSLALMEIASELKDTVSSDTSGIVKH
jgi:hypothetical protein